MSAKTKPAVAAVHDGIGSAAPAVDIEELLAPISGDATTGTSLRYEVTYDAIREARREDDPTLPQGVWQRELKKGDWPAVIDLCCEALTNKSKDLQLGCWLFEALVHQFDLDGAVQGLDVLTGLCERFWEDLFPEIEEGDLSGRSAVIEWLNERGSPALKRGPLTASPSANAIDFVWLDLEAAGSEPTPEEESTESRKQQIQAAVLVTSTEFYKRRQAALGKTREALEKLIQELDRRYNGEAPSLGIFAGAVESQIAFVSKELRERGAMSETPQAKAEAETGTNSKNVSVDEPGSSDGSPIEPNSSLKTPTTPVASRAEAYAMLAAAAEYLQATEPHSPTPYLLRRAIAWGGMSLADLLAELQELGSDLPTVTRLLGMEPSQRRTGRDEE